MNDIAFYVLPESDDEGAFGHAVNKLGLPILVGKVDELPDCPVFYRGTVEGMKDFQKKHRFRRVANHWEDIDWCCWSALTCTRYYSQWGDLLLTRNYGFYPLAELIHLKSQVWRHFADEKGYCYVRPNDNDKVFSGGVFKSSTFGPWLLQEQPGSVREDLLVLVGTPTPLKAEYRVVVTSRGEVVTASLYCLNDKLVYQSGCPDNVREIAEAAAKKWSPHPLFVLDIAVTEKDQAAIIECGSIHTCGLYECNLEKVIGAIREAGGKQ